MPIGPRTGLATRTPLVAVLALVAVAVFALLIVSEGGEAAPNLYVSSSDIVPDVDEPTRGTTVAVSVTVHNDGDTNATAVYVKLRDETAAKNIGVLGPFNCTKGRSKVVVFSWDLTGASAGGHTLKATVDPDDDISESDETDNSATKAVTVNLPPIAVARADTTSTRSYVSIGFNGSGSSDSDGTVQAYLWYFGDGTLGSGANVTHVYTNGGPSPGQAYNITLVVTDEDGGVGQNTITVRILNRPPVAYAEGATVNTHTPLSISGASSSDMDGKISKYEWTLHNGTVLRGSPAVVSYDDDGTYGVRLTVTDDDGATDYVDIIIRVLNQPPSVDLKANRTIVGQRDPISFNASGSRDIDGSITNFTWIFGDTHSGVGPVVEHSYSTNGSYKVTVVVVDDDGDLSTSSISIIVGNSPPVAVPTAEPGYVLTYENISFDGASSFDLDDNIVAYAWDFGDGISTTGAQIVHNYSDDGTYIVTLTVTDTAGAVGSSILSIVVANRPPEAVYMDLKVQTGEAAAFNGSMCSDRDGYISRWKWDCGGGAVYTTANASHVWEDPGTYAVTLTVWDDDGASDETTFQVTVLNRMPRAAIEASPLETTLTVPVIFNGSGSWDPDGTVVNWSWNFGDGARAYGVEVSHRYTAYGTYRAILTVRDDDGGINTTIVLVTVQNLPPVAEFDVTPTTALTGETLAFDARNSTDPENQIGEFYWSFGDGKSAKGPVVTHAYEDDGRFIVRLTVVDADSMASYAEIAVTIRNRYPVANTSAHPSEVKTFENVTFNGLASSDEDGGVLWYRWDFGDGTIGYGALVDHAFLDDGVYTVVLTVTDDDGDEATTTVDVKVLNRPPVAEAGWDKTTVTGERVHLDARGSYDMDGRVVEYHWDFGDGETASGAIVYHAFPRHSTFVVNLTVIDDDGASATDNMTVVVENVEPVAVITGELVVRSGEEIELDGSSSIDLDGLIVDHSWDLGDGDNAVGLTVRHAYTAVGTYTVTLSVEDDGGLKDTMQVEVQVLNRGPKAVIDADVTRVATGEAVVLEGTTSSDPDGIIKGYTWIFGDGAVSYGASVSHTYSDDGIYMVVLTVKDDGGATDSASMFVQVENLPPVPNITASDEVLTLVEVEFSASGSRDPDGKVTSYFWDFGDGDATTGGDVTHSYLMGGNYTVRLTVIDDDGRTALVTHRISVINRAPTAVADVVVEAFEGAPVKYDASGSRDPDGMIEQWHWSFGDGESGVGREAYHRYNQSGTYSWHVVVWDENGEQDRFSGEILIKERAFEPVEPEPTPEKEESPGPGAIITAIAVILATVLVGARRKARTT